MYSLLHLSVFRALRLYYIDNVVADLIYVCIFATYICSKWKWIHVYMILVAVVHSMDEMSSYISLNEAKNALFLFSLAEFFVFFYYISFFWALSQIEADFSFSSRRVFKKKMGKQQRYRRRQQRKDEDIVVVCVCVTFSRRRHWSPVRAKKNNFLSVFVQSKKFKRNRILGDVCLPYTHLRNKCDCMYNSGIKLSLCWSKKWCESFVPFSCIFSHRSG